MSNIGDAVARLLVTYRQRSEMYQEQAAERSGVGVKTISSFETGARTHTIKLVQLMRLLKIYEISLSTFEEDLNEMLIAERKALADAIALRLSHEARV